MKFTKWALRPDSGGRGRHRGGVGAVYEVAALLDDTEVFVLGERGKFPPLGVVGGEPGAPNRIAYEQDGGWHEPALVSKLTDVKLRRGQRVRLESPGGGGFGDPGERDRGAIARDLELCDVTR